ncbi:MAG: hypothetical protein ACOCWZ_00335 [Spirochaetota bacterium]
MKKAIICLVMLMISVPAYSNEVEDALKDLSTKIMKLYSKLPDRDKPKYMAILDFENESMLARRNNLGVAFSEILAQHLLRYIDKFENSFQQIGLNVFFSKNMELFWGFGINPYAGPSILNFLDKTRLYERTHDGLNDLRRPVTIRPSYMLFGMKAGMNLEYRFSMSYKIFVGGEYQYFPDFKVRKEITYETPVDPIEIKTILRDETIKLTGYSITAGAAYSF